MYRVSRTLSHTCIITDLMQNTFYFLFIRFNLPDVITIRDQHDILQNVKIIKVPYDSIMTERGKLAKSLNKTTYKYFAVYSR